MKRFRFLILVLIAALGPGALFAVEPEKIPQTAYLCLAEKIDSDEEQHLSLDYFLITSLKESHTTKLKASDDLDTLVWAVSFDGSDITIKVSDTNDIVLAISSTEIGNSITVKVPEYNLKLTCQPSVPTFKKV